MSGDPTLNCFAKKQSAETCQVTVAPSLQAQNGQAASKRPLHDEEPHDAPSTRKRPAMHSSENPILAGSSPMATFPSGDEDIQLSQPSFVVPIPISFPVTTVTLTKTPETSFLPSSTANPSFQPTSSTPSNAGSSSQQLPYNLYWQPNASFRNHDSDELTFVENSCPPLDRAFYSAAALKGGPSQLCVESYEYHRTMIAALTLWQEDQRQHSQAVERNQQLRQELSDVRAQKQKEIEEANKKLTKLEVLSSELSTKALAEKNSLQKEIDEVKSACCICKEEMISVKEELHTNQGQIKVMEDEVSKLKEELSKEREKISKASKEAELASRQYKDNILRVKAEAMKESIEAFVASEKFTEACDVACADLTQVSFDQARLKAKKLVPGFPVQELKYFPGEMVSATGRSLWRIPAASPKLEWTYDNDGLPIFPPSIINYDN